MRRAILYSSKQETLRGIARRNVHRKEAERETKKNADGAGLIAQADLTATLSRAQIDVVIVA